MAFENNISSNGISIAISVDPIYPIGTVETFADGDVWTDEAVETADAVKTPDGKMLVWGKNALYTRTLTLAPTSKLRKMLDLAIASQMRRGDAVTEPYSVTVTVTNMSSGASDTYTDGILVGGDTGMNVGQERLANRAYKFKFGNLVSI